MIVIEGGIQDDPGFMAFAWICLGILVLLILVDFLGSFFDNRRR